MLFLRTTAITLVLALLPILVILSAPSDVNAAAGQTTHMVQSGDSLAGCSMQLNAPYHSGSYEYAVLYVSCAGNDWRNSQVCLQFDDAEQYCQSRYGGWVWGSNFDVTIAIHTVYSPGTYVNAWAWLGAKISGQQRTQFLGDYQTSWVDG